MKLTKLEQFALLVNHKIGTIQFTIICFLLVTIPLVKPETQTVVFYISSGYLQLILLPLIILGNNVQEKLSEFHAEKHYKAQEEHDKKLEKLIKELKKKK